MDTKSRVAIFAGAVVLVGLVAWMLVPHGSKPKDDTQTADNSTPAVDVAAAGATTQPSTQPVAAADPFAPTNTAAAGATPAPSTQPVAITMDRDPSPAAAPQSNDAWARALDGNASPNTITVGGGNNASPFAGSKALSGKTYKVQSGDSLYSIAEKTLGSGKYLNKLVAANPKVDPKRLKVGQEINIPDLSTDTAAPSPTADHTTPAIPSVSSSSDKTYKVQPGDSLRKIAAHTLGDSGKWEKIYAANKKAIGSDPSRLRAGMVLQIP